MALATNVIVPNVIVPNGIVRFLLPTALALAPWRDPSECEVEPKIGICPHRPKGVRDLKIGDYF